MTEILTPKSERWESFAETLYLSLYPDGQDKGSNCMGDAGSDVHRHAKEIMTAMGGIDIAASLEFFKDHGGYCDCEILMNIDRG